MGFSQMYLGKRIINIDLFMVGRGRFWQAVGKNVKNYHLLNEGKDNGTLQRSES